MFWFPRFCWVYFCRATGPDRILSVCFGCFLYWSCLGWLKAYISCFGLFVLCSILHTRYGCFNISTLYLVSFANILVSLSNCIWSHNLDVFINQHLHLVCCHRLEPSFSLELKDSTHGDSPYQNEGRISSNRFFYWETFLQTSWKLTKGFAKKVRFPNRQLL